jgi:hypothetical protein
VVCTTGCLYWYATANFLWSWVRSLFAWTVFSPLFTGAAKLHKVRLPGQHIQGNSLLVTRLKSPSPPLSRGTTASPARSCPESADKVLAKRPTSLPELRSIRKPRTARDHHVGYYVRLEGDVQGQGRSLQEILVGIFVGVDHHHRHRRSMHVSQLPGVLRGCDELTCVQNPHRRTQDGSAEGERSTAPY